MKTHSSYWTFRAETETGRVESGIVQGDSEAEAIAVLRARRLMPLALAKRQTANLIYSRLLPGRRNRLSLHDLADVSKRMSDLLSAGLPLSRTLSLCAKQSQNERQGRFYSHLENEIRSGVSLSEAMANCDVQTPKLMRALVRAGESLGSLPAQFERLSAHYAEIRQLRRDIVSQLIYPTALVFLIFITIIFLSFFVLPQFESIFETTGEPPPWETRIALATGAFVRANGVYIPFVVLGLLLIWRANSVRFRVYAERVLLAAPVIGRYQREAEIGRYIRALSTLLSGGMSLSDALPLAAEAIESPVLREALNSVEHKVRGGEQLAAAMTQYVRLPPEIVSFLEVGEEAGELAAMSGEAARFAEERTKSAIKRSMSLLGPALTAIMGVITASIIAAIMSGILSLNDTAL